MLTGKEALIALANGEDVQVRFKTMPANGWFSVSTTRIQSVDQILNGGHEFRLKPRTITINGIEVKTLTKNCPIYENDGVVKIECDSQEDAVKLVAALRFIFK